MLFIFVFPVNADVQHDVQDGLYALGYKVKPDGKIGSKTTRAIKAFIDKNSSELYPDDFTKISDTINKIIIKRAVDDAKKVSWSYKSAEISIAADNHATNVFKGLDSIKSAVRSGFNNITLTFNCSGRERIQFDAPISYPLSRRTGCLIPYAKYGDDFSASRDATDIYISEAKKYGMTVTLKPMFLSLTRKNDHGYEYGKIPTKDFFDGNGTTFDGYIEIIKRIAKYSESKNVDYLQIGTEFINLNRKIPKSNRWSNIIKNIKNEFSGKLIYAHNLGPEGSRRDMFNYKEIWKSVDYIGINFYPSNVLNGKKYYTSAEISRAFKKASIDSGNGIKSLQKLSKLFSKKIIMTETSFPTWRGSANWMFRIECDYDNKGKSGWLYTEGPLASKEPSLIAAQVLADGWYHTFKDLNFIAGANHSFWYLTWHDGTHYPKYNKRVGLSECSRHIFKNEGLKQIISAYYK